MVQKSVLEAIDDPGLTVLNVWVPVLRGDNEEAARRATVHLPDARVRHFWFDGRELGESFQAPIGLEGRPAWDVYLVYAPGVRWEESPPKPSFFVHQLRKLPEDRLLLDGETLVGSIREHLRS